MLQHAPDLCPPAADGLTTAARPAPCGHPDGTPAPGWLAAVLRLAASLADQLATADTDADVSVEVAYRYAEDRPAVRFLATGESRCCLASVAACSRLFGIPLTVSAPVTSSGRAVWVGGSTVRAGVCLTARALLTAPAAVAEARRVFPAGTGGW